MKCIFSLKICIVLCLCFVLFSGCILPVPHKRLSQCGLEGVVVDFNTCQPISNAVVSVSFDNNVVETTTTDDLGRWKISEKHTWHGAFLFAIPMSYSIFPFGYLPSYPSKLNIEAEGYTNFSTSNVFFALSKFSEIGIPLTSISEQKCYGIPLTVEIDEKNIKVIEQIRKLGAESP